MRLGSGTLFGWLMLRLRLKRNTQRRIRIMWCVDVMMMMLMMMCDVSPSQHQTEVLLHVHRVHQPRPIVLLHQHIADSAKRWQTLPARSHRARTADAMALAFGAQQSLHNLRGETGQALNGAHAIYVIYEIDTLNLSADTIIVQIHQAP